MPATSGATSGAFAVPTTGHTESDVWFRIHLIVTDSGGLTSSTYRDVMPQLARIQLATSPTGLQLRLDDQPVTTPYSFTGVVGVERKLEAVSPQTVGGSTWYYQSWSNGGTRVQTISTPPADMTYTATFANAPPPPSFRAYVNFQPASAPPVTGYYVDSGDVYGDRGNGYTYGWNASTSSAVYDRNSSRSPDQRYDTLIQTQHFSNPNAVWEIAVANGNYAVRVVAGDPMSHNSVYEVAVEGVLTLDGTPTETSRWVEGTKTVAVSDGRLTISSAAGASNNKLCFVEITAVG
jgi:hypothetical protein